MYTANECEQRFKESSSTLTIEHPPESIILLFISHLSPFECILFLGEINSFDIF